MSKISIILPIYNVEKYLNRCVDSVISQTLEDIEIILATDGPESCDKICEEYAIKDSRIKIVSHPGSYGKAFNKSLEIASGEYIGIVETDDWCDLTMFEKLYNKAKENDADVVKCGFYFAYDDENKNTFEVLDEYNENLDIFKNQNFLSSQPSVWSCIYKKDFLTKNNIKMIEDRMSFIDSPFHYETLVKAKKYILLKEALYYYYQENENQTVKNVKPLDGLNSEIYAYEKIKNSEIWDTVKEGYIFSTALHLRWNFERLKNKDKNLFWKAAHKYVVNLNLDGVSYFYFDKNLKKLFFEIKKHKSYSSMKKYYLFRNLIGIIFSLKNDYIYKVVTICAIKIKFKNKKLIKRHEVDKNSFLEDVFSVKNNDIRKIITIMGIKFKFKNKKLLKRHNIKKNSFVEDIFSIRNLDTKKVITILGIKIKFPNTKSIISKLNTELETSKKIAEEKSQKISVLETELRETKNIVIKKEENLQRDLNDIKNRICNIDNAKVINDIAELLGFSNNSEKNILKKNLTSIEIEIFSYCNRQCWFCPNSFIDRHSDCIFMDENLYLNILQQLKDIDYSKVITYSRYNEPLSNKDVFLKRLAQARAYCPHAFLRTNSNGDFLTSIEYLDELANAGLNEIEIQCYLAENQEYSREIFEKKAKVFANRFNLPYHIEDYGEWMCACFDYDKLNFTYAIRDFKNIANNRGESLSKNQKEFFRMANCLVPYQHIYVDYNGECMLCCNLRHDIEAHRQFIVGDANKTPLDKIFMSETQLKYRRLLSCDGNNIHPCCSCKFFVSQKDMNLIEI